MKKLFLKYNVLLCLSLLSTSMIFGQNTGVFWLEGNGQGGGIWNNYTTFFDSIFQMNSFNNGYDHIPDVTDTHINDPGVVGTAQDADFRIFAPNNPDPNNDIAIGHSLGGVTLRELDINPIVDAMGIANRRFSAAITIGSPLDGAGIAQSVQNGNALMAVNDGQVVLFEPFRRQFGLVANGNNGLNPAVLGNPPVIITQAGNQLNLNTLLTATFPFMFAGIPVPAVNVTVPFAWVINQNPFNPTQTEIELATGSLYQTNISNATTTTPIINISGDEVSPVHYRIITSLLNDADDELVPRWNGTFNPNFRNGLTIRDISGGMYSMAGALNLFFATRNPIKAPVRIWRAAAWLNGANLIYFRSEKVYQELMQVNQWQTTTVCIPSWRCIEDMYEGCMDIFNDPVHCTDWCTTDICFTTAVLVNGGSDGFIGGNSQRALNSSWGDNPITIPELNHAEMWLHNRLRQDISDIFDGIHPDVNATDAGSFVILRQ